jgi:chromosomal replication initiator protein
MSSDKPPRDIPTLEDRLRSRFAWGMSIDMQTPDFETRCAIIQSKAQANGVVLQADVVEFLANLVHSNIRELEGVLNQLLAYCEMRNLTPDLAVAEALFASSANRPKHITPRQILEQTARYYSIDLTDLMSPKRDKEIVVPRQVAMHLLRSELKLSFPKIATECGRKDHTTAIHAVDKIAKELATDPQLRQQVVELKGRLYA